MDILIIPTYERPEFLWLCLEKIAANDCSNIEIWICEDEHIDHPKSEQLQQEISTTVVYARALFADVKHFKTEHVNHGSSFNVLESFKKACQTDAEFVFFVEDDCLVTPDWIKWCRAAHEQFDPFATCGNASRAGQDLRQTSISDRWFQTFALSFRRDRLKKALLDNYSNYNLTPTFEWDAYLMRHILASGQYAASACIPRVYHYGFFGYHRTGNRTDGDLQARIEFIRRGALDTSLLPPVWDFKPFPKRDYIWQLPLIKHGWTVMPKRLP